MNGFQKEVARWRAQAGERCPITYVYHYPFWRTTVALAVRADGVVFYGSARASKRGQWSRAAGMAISEARALKHMAEYIEHYFKTPRGSGEVIVKQPFVVYGSRAPEGGLGETARGLCPLADMVAVAMDQCHRKRWKTSAVTVTHTERAADRASQVIKAAREGY
jgi:hypothetical protein